MHPEKGQYCVFIILLVHPPNSANSALANWRHEPEFACSYFLPGYDRVGRSFGVLRNWSGSYLNTNCISYPCLRSNKIITGGLASVAKFGGRRDGCLKGRGCHLFIGEWLTHQRSCSTWKVWCTKHISEWHSTGGLNVSRLQNLDWKSSRIKHTKQYMYYFHTRLGFGQDLDQAPTPVLFVHTVIRHNWLGLQRPQCQNAHTFFVFVCLTKVLKTKVLTLHPRPTHSLSVLLCQQR